MRMRAALFYFCFLFFFLGKSQPVYFENRYGSSYSESSQSVQQMADGSIYIGGYSDSVSQNGVFDPSISKFDRYGNWLWTKHYSSPESDYGFYLYVLPDSKIILVGEIGLGGVNGTDAQIIKTDSSGNLIWKKTFGGPYSQSIEYVDATADGNLIACGYTSDSTGNDVWIVKMDTAGTILWQKKLGGPLVDYSDYIKQTPDGGYISSAVTSSFGAGGTDGWLLRLDQNGDTLWTRTSGNQYSGGCQGVCATTQGDFILYGEEETSAGSWFNFFMTKYDANGNFIWKKNFGGSGSDAIFDMFEAPDKGFYGVGYSNSYSMGPLNLIFFKTDSVGTVEWKTIYGNAGIDIGYYLIPSMDNGFLITGSSNLPDDQYYLLHLDSLGGLTGINSPKIHDFDFFVFPNPGHDKIFISVPSQKGKLEVEICDMNGKVYMKQDINNPASFEIQIPPDISSGMYFIKLKSEKGISVRKFIRD
ncbi:MAG: T9SS type A sorting domain-containing protein [Bacteroidia bacterium]|nr:T9SS type A sorting domain-containing protein [Bacteroidia bacterium]